MSSFLLSFISANPFLKPKHFIFVSPWSYSHSIALWVSMCCGFIQPDLLKLLMLAWFLLVEIVTGQAKQVIHLYNVAYIFNIRNYAHSSKTTAFEIPWWKNSKVRVSLLCKERVSNNKSYSFHRILSAATFQFRQSNYPEGKAWSIFHLDGKFGW